MVRLGRWTVSGSTIHPSILCISIHLSPKNVIFPHPRPTQNKGLPYFLHEDRLNQITLTNNRANHQLSIDFRMESLSIWRFRKSGNFRELGGQPPVGRSTTTGKMITGTFSMMQRVPMLDPWDPKHVISHAEKIWIYWLVDRDSESSLAVIEDVHMILFNGFLWLYV